MGQNPKLRGVGIVLACGLGLVFSFAASAQMLEVRLPAPYRPTPGTPLSKMKISEGQAKWAECARLGPSALQSHASVRGWVLRSWLKCANFADQNEKKLNALPAALRAYEAQRNQSPGAWSENNRQTAVSARLWLLENFMKSNPKLGDQHLNLLMQDLQPRETENLARAWALTGDLAHLRHDLPGSEVAYSQSLKLNSQPGVQEKLRAVRLALNRPEPGPEADEVTSEVYSDIEQKFANRFKASKEKNDLLLQLEDALAYLQELPNGLQSKWAAQLVLDIHQVLFNRTFDTTSGDRAKMLRERSIAMMDDADPERIKEWIPVVYRRGDYDGSGKLAEAVTKRYEKTSAGDQVLWYAARSAQLTGNYKKADRYFSQFFERHGGSDLARDAEFQWALTLMQMGDYASASARFERLLRDPEAGRYELSARYWLVRAMQALGNPRAAEEINLVISKFPASYYGIRLRAESQNAQFEWPFSQDRLKSLRGSLRLNSKQKQAWDRLLVLRANGWGEEALAETDELPLPEDPTLKVLWAQELARAEAFPKVIRLLNEISDLAPDLRSMDVLQLGLPKSYQEDIQTHATKNNLSPVLVRSLIRQESAFNPRAVSRSNAMGLMQLVPGTAKEVATDLKMGSLNLPEDAFRAPLNVQMGSAYLSKMLRQFSGSVPVALAAYNAGPRRIEAFLQARPDLRESLKTPSSDPLTEVWFDELPWSETSFYVKAILRNSLLYKTQEQKKISLNGVLWADLLLPSNVAPALVPQTAPSLEPAASPAPGPRRKNAR